MTPTTVNEDNRSISGVLTTETPVVVFDWERWEPVKEVLMMDGVDLPERVPLLDAHTRFSSHNIVGSTMDFVRDVDEHGNPVIRATNYFSSTEDELYTKAKEGHITDTSIGYKIDPEESEFIEKGDSVEINGRTFTNDSDMRMVVRKKWSLKENSLVPIGADKMAKLRSELPPIKEEKVDEPLKVARSLKMNRNIHNHLNNLK